MIIAGVQKKAEKRKGAKDALHTNTRVCVSFVTISSGLVDKKLAEVQKKNFEEVMSDYYLNCMNPLHPSIQESSQQNPQT